MFFQAVASAGFMEIAFLYARSACLKRLRDCSSVPRLFQASA